MNLKSTGAALTLSSHQNEHMKSYTREQVEDSSSSEDGRILMIIRDQVVDVSKFLDRHPGGDLVLLHSAGKDCTDAFENYHRKQVAKYLPMLVVGRVSDYQEPALAPHVQDFRLLREEMRRGGMYTLRLSYYIKLYCWLAALFGASLYLSLGRHSVLCHMAGALLLGVFWQQFAGLAHDIGHSQILKGFGRNHWLGSVVGCCLFGVSTAWWKRSHNTHHVVPNSVENDPDIQHMPLLAVSEKILERPFWSSFYSKYIHFDTTAQFFVRYQHILFLPLMLLGRFNLYLQSLLFLTDTNKRTDFRTVELCSLAVFACWYLAVALSMETWGETAAWILLSHAVTGFLHIQIVVSHWSMDIYHGRANDWYTVQLDTTMNIACSPWMDWLHVGLQFQIEHHLFPTLPRHSLREASRMVQCICHRHGLRYSSRSFPQAVQETLKVLAQVAEASKESKKVPNLLVAALNAEG